VAAGTSAATRLVGTAATAGHEPGLVGACPPGHGPGLVGVRQAAGDEAGLITTGTTRRSTTRAATRHKAGLVDARRTRRGDIAAMSGATRTGSR
jgi:hypothetical protein